jgi:hypothetical protein
MCARLQGQRCVLKKGKKGKAGKALIKIKRLRRAIGKKKGNEEVRIR